MKKLALVALLVAACAQPIKADNGCCTPKQVPSLCNACDCKVTSHTFFTIRPLYQPASPELESLTYDKMDARVDGYGGFIEATVFGSSSTNSANMAAFFMPNCRTQLIVKEDENDPNKDILASEFNIVTTDGDFASVIGFAPKQTVLGLGITYRQSFLQCPETEFWWGISAPIMRIKNSVGFFEQVTNNGGGVRAVADDVAVANMTEAFKQPTWHFGRIDCNCSNNTKTAIGDITVEVGYEYLKKECANLESYAGFLIPTGNEVKGITVFEPIVGHNKHAGFIFGSSGGMEIWNKPDQDKSLWIEIHFYGRYLFSRTETRLIDVKGKPWSRYMEVYKNKDEAQLAFNSNDVFGYTPGVNVFAQKLCVSPGFQRTINFAMLYTRCALQLEGGYNLYCRPAECVKLKYGWQEGPAFKAIKGSGFTNNLLTIQGGFINPNVAFGETDISVDQYDLSLIKFSDLDLNSAAHPTVISHTFYGALGYRFDRDTYPLFVGFGGSYEFTEDNSGIDRFVIWGKFGLSF